MNRAKGNLIVEIKGDDEFLSIPVLPFSFQWNRKSRSPAPTIRALALPSVCAIGPVTFPATGAPEDPDLRIVVRTGLLGLPQHGLVRVNAHFQCFLLIPARSVPGEKPPQPQKRSMQVNRFIEKSPGLEGELIRG